MGIWRRGNETRKEGMMSGKWKMEKEEWRIVEIYVNEDREKVRGIEEMDEKEESRRVIIGGNFNARTGEMGADQYGGEARNIKD